MSTKSAAAVTTVQELNARFGSLQDRLRQAAEAVASDGATLPVSFFSSLFINSILWDTRVGTRVCPEYPGMSRVYTYSGYPL